MPAIYRVWSQAGVRDAEAPRTPAT
jgi:hypothetical protein